MIEDSECDESSEVLTRLQQCSSRSIIIAAVAADAADEDGVLREFLAAVQVEFSSPSTCCSIVSVKKASTAYV